MKVRFNRKFRSDKLLHDEHGFIYVDVLVMVPLIFMLIIVMVLSAEVFVKNFRNYIDTWVMQSEVQRIMEDIIVEIEYADTVEYQYPGEKKSELIISTRRRATVNTNEEVKYLSFKNTGKDVYRCELTKAAENLYWVASSQPLSGENYFSDSRITFTCEQLADDLYKIDVDGYSYKAVQTFHLQTVVLKRS